MGSWGFPDSPELRPFKSERCGPHLVLKNMQSRTTHNFPRQHDKLFYSLSRILSWWLLPHCGAVWRPCQCPARLPTAVQANLIPTCWHLWFLWPLEPALLRLGEPEGRWLPGAPRNQRLIEDGVQVPCLLGPWVGALRRGVHWLTAHLPSGIKLQLPTVLAAPL